MKKSYRNPKKWEWYLPAAIFVIGTVLFLTPWKDRAMRVIAIGIGLKCALNIRWNNYRGLSPDEQKQIDREERDERNRMLRERASWLCWQGERALFTVCFLTAAFVLDLESSVLYLVCLLYVARELIYEAVYRRLDKKY